jgi:hypothetical protein
MRVTNLQCRLVGAVAPNGPKALEGKRPYRIAAAMGAVNSANA